ncbi:TraU family protein [Comamonas testosteroni]|uniref:TraU family protein n=1 Tax=Comamonas testosteroni TaxID=285 RepID=UPI0009B8822B|nr:TraU family protein [Comamonas testosteroni]WKL18793.1 TraU family protein [Comamonas testosteroni]
MHIKRIVVAFWLLMMSSLSNAEVGCYSADLIGPKLFTDICWSCIFPIRVAGIPISGPGGSFPEDSVTSPLCACEDTNGIPRPGITTSMWEPARLVEFQRVPGCSSVLNGIRFPFDRLNQGNHSNSTHDGSDGTFMHYHFYAFPLLIMMDLFVNQKCNPDGYMDLDVMYMSELDPTWNNDELAFFTNPEAAAVANPIAAAACSADAIASTAGKPLKQMFWCAGSWGALYPLSGNQNGGRGVIRESSLLKTRVLAALHRRGLSWKTMGSDALCGGYISPTLPKTQYKFNLVAPIPEANSSHVVGESTLTWGIAKTIPSIGQDPVYMVWRWNDCCNTKIVQ